MPALRSADTLRDETRFAPWVRRITANACYDMLRRRKREREALYQEQHLQDVFESPAEESLLPVLMRLPSAVSRVLILYYYENFSTAEIAQVLRVPGATVRMRLTRGRRQLREMLEEDVQ